jgi:hypothetical protein
MITAAKRCMTQKKKLTVRDISRYKNVYIPTLGLYSAFLAWRAMVLRSRRQSRFTVATIFCRVGTIPSTAVICCCSSVKGTGVEGTCVDDDEVDVWALQPRSGE